MIYRIFPIKDTFITNDVRQYVRRTGSNVGAAEALEVFKSSGVSGAIGTLGSSSLARVLIQFDVNAVAALTASSEVPSTGVRYKLRVNHKTSADTLPFSYSMTLSPVSRSWDEGRGVDDDGLEDLGVANWDKATSTVWWTTPGGDFIATPSASAYFDTGYEDIDVDVSSLFNAWLTGGLVNHGIGVRMTASVESDSVYVDYSTKKFYSRTSNFQDRRPYVELSWNDVVRDDRSNMRWGRTGSLVLYNIVNGQLTNFGTNPIASIRDLSGTLLSVTSSYSGIVGIYSATFALPSSSYSGSSFFDGWRLGGTSLMTGTFTFMTDGATVDAEPPFLAAKVRNRKSEYVSDEVVRFDVFFKRSTYLLPSVLTGTNIVRPYIVEKSYYAIENDATSQAVVPFGTGTDEPTRLSYDKDGNYFKFYMRNLHPGNVYRIMLLVDEYGYRQVVDSGFRFKVV